jgi:hypothetical protein
MNDDNHQIQANENIIISPREQIDVEQKNTQVNKSNLLLFSNLYIFNFRLNLMSIFPQYKSVLIKLRMIIL